MLSRKYPAACRLVTHADNVIDRKMKLLKNDNNNCLNFQFDTDYEEFRLKIDSLKQQLQGFLDSWFDRSLTVSSLFYSYHNLCIKSPFAIVCLKSRKNHSI